MKKARGFVFIFDKFNIQGIRVKLISSSHK
jgi:hypothetical protein